MDVKIGPADRQDIVRTLEILYDWYGNEGSGVTENLVDAVASLVKHFSYKPYNGPLYRSFPIVGKWPANIKVGGTFRYKVATKNFQSWTTSAQIADLFGSEKYKDNYVVVKLESPAHEILNYRWIREILDKLSVLPDSQATGKMRLWARKVLGLVRAYDWEDEVILKARPVLDVKLIQIQASKDKIATATVMTNLQKTLKAFARLEERAGYTPAPLQQDKQAWTSNSWTVTFRNATYSELYDIVNGLFEANRPVVRTLLVRDTQLKLDFTINPGMGYGFTMFLPRPVDGETARELCRKFLSKWFKGIFLGPVDPQYPFDIEVASWVQPKVDLDD